jgi:hypothetical protein
VSAPATALGERQLDAVERLLLRLCRRDAGALGASDLAPLERRDFRDDLRALAARHRISGLVLVALREQAESGRLGLDAARELLHPERSAGSPRLPGQGERLRTLEELCARAEEKDREIERLLSCLAAHGLEPVVLKGPALQRLAYRHPVERRYSDFDLLFPAASVDRAIEAALGAGYAFPFSPESLKGYRELHFHVLLRRAPRFRAEIHWGLVKPTSSFRLDADAFLRRSRPLGSAPRAMRVPCAEHLLLHMAHENLRDAFSRLARIVDLDRIVAAAPELDWDYVVAQARAGGLGPLLSLALDVSRALLGTAVPSELPAALRPGAAARAHLRWMRPAPSLLRQSWRAPGPSACLRFWLSVGSAQRRRVLLRLLSGRQWAESWMFRDTAQGPPPARTALANGLKTGAKLAGYELALHAGALRERLSRLRRGRVAKRNSA